MTKFKKMMSVTLAGCMAASALMMSAGATRRDGKADDTELSSAAMIVSSVPQSDEEILAEYNEYQKNGAFSLDEDTTDTYSTVTENDESAPYIVSSEPISDEEIEQNMKNTVRICWSMCKRVVIVSPHPYTTWEKKLILEHSILRTTHTQTIVS